MPENPVEFTLTRTFDAPRDLVWKAFTESERLMHWWGPKGFKMKVAQLDLRPGGLFHYAMTAPDGRDMWGKFVYREVTPPERLVFVVSFSDESAGTTRHPMATTWPLEVLNTVIFTEQDGKTTLHMTGHPINETEEERRTFQGAHKSLEGGFSGTLNQLVDYLKSLTA